MNISNAQEELMKEMNDVFGFLQGGRKKKVTPAMRRNSQLIQF